MTRASEPDGWARRGPSILLILSQNFDSVNEEINRPFLPDSKTEQRPIFLGKRLFPNRMMFCRR